MLRFPIYLNAKETWCSRSGCKRKPFKDYLCRQHWTELQRESDPWYGRPNRPPKLCKMDDCSRPARLYGYCTLHAQRVRRNGAPVVFLLQRDPIYPIGQMPKMCINEGCTKPTNAAGRCAAHYVEWCKYGDTGPPPRYDTCPVCRRHEYLIALGNGMCFRCIANVRARNARPGTKHETGFWDRETCLVAGRAWYELTGYAPRTEDWRAVGSPAKFPGISTIYRLFGTFTNFINELGLPQRPVGRKAA